MAHQLFLLLPVCSKSRRASNLPSSGEELRVPPKGHFWAEHSLTWQAPKRPPRKLCKFQKQSEQFSDLGKAEGRSHRAHPCPFKWAPSQPCLRGTSCSLPALGCEVSSLLTQGNTPEPVSPQQAPAAQALMPGKKIPIVLSQQITGTGWRSWAGPSGAAQKRFCTTQAAFPQL